MEQIDPRHLLTRIAEILRKFKIPYMVTGGMAVFIWGRPRFTADIDIVVELNLAIAEKLIPVLRSLSDFSYIDEGAVRDAINRFGEFNFIDGESGIKVDFWILKNDLFNRARLKRCIPKTILKRKVFFISPEDLILTKLLWYKSAGTSRHLEDVESILKISGKKLDIKYLKKWAKKSGVLSILSKLI